VNYVKQELEVQLSVAGCRCHSPFKSVIADLQSGVATDDDTKLEPGSTPLETPSLCPRRSACIEVGLLY